MIIALIVTLALPALAAFALIRYLWPWGPVTRAEIAVQLALAIGLGIAIASCSYFLCLLALGSLGPRYPILESFAFIAIAVLLFRRQRTTERAFAEGIRTNFQAPLARIVVAACALGFAVCLIDLVIFSLSNPHGYWDAWAIWNLRARFLFRAGEYWREAFNENLSWSHPDYPLLLPGAVARCWTYLGGDPTAAPATIAILFTLSTTALLAAAIALFRGAASGLLAGLLLLSTDYYLRHGAIQYADTAVSFFVLATLVLTYFHSRDSTGSARFLAPAGLSATCAAWTKNEGSVILVCWLVSLFVARILPGPRGSRIRSHFALAGGLLPVAAILFYFKIVLAPMNDLAGGLSNKMLHEHLTDSRRYGEILLFFGKNLVELSRGAGPLLLIYLCLVGRARDRAGRRGLIAAVSTLTLMFLAICMIYVVTPQDVTWHMETSGRRLLLQLYPSAVFTIFIAAAPMAAVKGEAPQTIEIEAGMR